ncbi:hypothetical protein AVEN_182556-1 [Araneus ventricosus]|uniref:Uncharacterized protein n=1 Tax=Araneus ventricosus TaxID=182803 RepID=A0A4Y2V5L5_ARAVE|nr:hypothetical protein AVEN_182556-1 [Araneus ventricosus]
MLIHRLGLPMPLSSIRCANSKLLDHAVMSELQYHRTFFLQNCNLDFCCKPFLLFCLYICSVVWRISADPRLLWVQRNRQPLSFLPIECSSSDLTRIVDALTSKRDVCRRQI